jgi:hypothetical protein
VKIENPGGHPSAGVFFYSQAGKASQAQPIADREFSDPVQLPAKLRAG